MAQPPDSIGLTINSYHQVHHWLVQEKGKKSESRVDDQKALKKIHK